MDIKSWIRQNKAVVGIGGLGGLLFLSQRGGKQAAAISSGAHVVQVPIVGVRSDDYDNADIYEQRRDRPTIPESEITAPQPLPTGVVIQGREFPGATGYTISGSSNGWVRYVINFAGGRTERWSWHASEGWEETWNNVTDGSDFISPTAGTSVTGRKPVPVGDDGGTSWYADTFGQGSNTEWINYSTGKRQTGDAPSGGGYERVGFRAPPGSTAEEEAQWSADRGGTVGTRISDSSGTYEVGPGGTVTKVA